mmetsp:Transcript_17532/g.61283  ORF Transcript_17532/g.61283 Transcript_17532/m.61283 type:complete len:141 (+) Transcript_17532:964-1386(+)
MTPASSSLLRPRPSISSCRSRDFDFVCARMGSISLVHEAGKRFAAFQNGALACSSQIDGFDVERARRCGLVMTTAQLPSLRTGHSQVRTGDVCDAGYTVIAIAKTAYTKSCRDRGTNALREHGVESGFLTCSSHLRALGP